MLVLKRKKQESIIINDNIRVVILGYENGQVKLGIEAPRDVSVHREEVYINIQREADTTSAP